MSKPRSKMPPLTAFGAVLQSLRNRRSLTTAQVETALTKGAAKLGRSTVSQYEQGAVWAPDAVVLAEMARIYRSDLNGLVALLKANRQNLNLTNKQADAILKGASDAGTAATRLLEEREEAYAAAISEMRAVAVRLVGFIERQDDHSVHAKTSGGESG